MSVNAARVVVALDDYRDRRNAHSYLCNCTNPDPEWLPLWKAFECGHCGRLWEEP